jgi:hypothetical protein
MSPEKVLPLLKDLIDCEDCGGDGDCWECFGSGKCSTCSGDGEHQSPRAYCNTLYWDNGIQQRCDRRAPEGAGKDWQCDEHKRQAKYLDAIRPARAERAAS